jgi:hypothetical protein
MINNGIYLETTKEAAKRGPCFKFYLYLFYDSWTAMLSTCIGTTMILLRNVYSQQYFALGT